MQRAFYFDQTRCIGCFTCCVACKDWHDIPAGPAHWRRVLPFEEGKFPNLFLAYLSTACYHCEDPLCAAVCPAEAITKREEDGVVVIDRKKCRESARCGITIANGNGPTDLAACEVTCPAHVDVPGYIALAAKGRLKEALDLMREKLPLPGVLGRVCSQPCESECKRGGLDKPLAIRDLKRFICDSVVDGKVTPLPITKSQSVAIIGSGPAGLSAAYDLLKRGYRVTVFEALPVAGGMLTVGIPRYRLPREVIERDIDYLKALGIEIKTDSPIGKGMTLDDLSRQGYEAIFIAVGAHHGQKLSIPGAESENVLAGSSFLRDVNMGKPVKLGQRVLVLGGGNIAIDCARVALRLGAKRVEIACRRSREAMRALASEVAEAEEEGIVIHPSLTFKSIVCQNGRATGVECLKLSTDAIAGTEHILPSDTIIFAVGQSPELDFLAGTNIKTTQQGTIAIDPATMQTSRPGVFAGGDAVTGTGWVIDAIAAGQRAVYYIDLYLRGEVLKRVDMPITAADIEVEIPPEIAKRERQEMPTLSVRNRAHNFEEIALGYNQERAIAEARRCLNCAGRLCLRVCPYDAPQFGAEEGAKMQKCDFCLDRLEENKKPACVDACIMRALDAGPIEELKTKYGAAQEATGFKYSASTRPSIVFKPKTLSPAIAPDCQSLRRTAGGPRERRAGQLPGGNNERK
ncbi:MAG: FAD-dependent oxidoreductase [Chloroflexi bacterium]|nr:FAD-dependent oxidoreductase [Chloroflexota bacterium]